MRQGQRQAGEVLFCIKNDRPVYSLTLIASAFGKKPLMLAIKKFVDNLSEQPIHLPKSIDYSRSLIYDQINSRNNLKPYVQIKIGEFTLLINFLFHYLISYVFSY